MGKITHSGRVLTGGFKRIYRYNCHPYSRRRRSTHDNDFQAKMQRPYTQVNYDLDILFQFGYTDFFCPLHNP